MNWLVDTNVISETRKIRPSSSVIDWLSSLNPECLFTSRMNIVELRYGAMVLEDQIKQSALLRWVNQVVTKRFFGRIVEIDEVTLLKWREITRQREIQRHPAPAVDLLIAAAAIQNNLSIATRDVAPFVACGIPTLNPFTGERYNGA